MARCPHDRAEWRESMVGVPYCPLCRAQDRPELMAMLAGLAFAMQLKHERLLQMSEAETRKARVQ